MRRNAVLPPKRRGTPKLDAARAAPIFTAREREAGLVVCACMAAGVVLALCMFFLELMR